MVTMVDISQYISEGQRILEESLLEIQNVIDDKGQLKSRTPVVVDILGKIRLKLCPWSDASVKLIKEISMEDYQRSIDYRDELVGVFDMALDSCGSSSLPVNFYRLITKNVGGLIGILKGLMDCNEAKNIGGTSIFIVHGHDTELLEEVRDYVTTLEKNPVILSEEANKGRFLLEKFIDESSRCGFAVILMTADDVGGTESSP